MQRKICMPEVLYLYSAGFHAGLLGFEGFGSVEIVGSFVATTWVQWFKYNGMAGKSAIYARSPPLLICASDRDLRSLFCPLLIDVLRMGATHRLLFYAM